MFLSKTGAGETKLI